MFGKLSAAPGALDTRLAQVPVLIGVVAMPYRNAPLPYQYHPHYRHQCAHRAARLSVSPAANPAAIRAPRSRFVASASYEAVAQRAGSVLESS